MNTSDKLEVIYNGGHVDIVPAPERTFSAESLCEVIAQIKAKLGFKGRISAGTDMFFYWDTPKFGLRLHGATAVMAKQLRDMDLFPPQQLENLDKVEIRFVHENVAYVDPRQVLKLGTMIEFASALGNCFRTKARFWLQGTQFVFDANTNLVDVDDEMIAFCNPLYRHLSKIVGRARDGYVWVELEGPDSLLKLSSILRQEHVLQNPEPIRTPSRFSAWPGMVAIAVDAKVETAADVKRLYRLAIEISMRLGIHPLGDFTFIHEEGLTTTLRTSTLSSR